ncbi:hypothetical protein BpHYR1_019155 [Brachionus plicatilis]|uniref:Uncharacterized protein n=1 Tax=Brachionus plicatilis TaxID=10195 RepID=A0A3M7PDX8_BRAPC|nr:hypothetical protein BpHYR1_019155 [Brachionus plicatilis]
MSTKSFNYIDKVSVLKENINKSNNSDDSSQSSKQTESLSAIKKKFEANSSQEIDEFEDFFKSKPVFKRDFRFKSLKFEPNLSVKNKPVPNSYPKPSLIEPSSPKTKTTFELNNNPFDKPNQNIKRSFFISKNTMESGATKMEENTDNQSSDSPNSSKEPKLSFYKKDFPINEEKSTEAKNSHESSPVNFGMTIQERMAALRKNGEEDWRKRSTSTSNEEKPISGSNLVRQQKEQLKQQLNQINIASRSNSNIKRNVLVPFLNEIKATQKHENLSDDNEELNIKKNKISQSNESLDIIVSHNQNILDKPPIKIQEKRPSPIKQSKLSRIHSAGSDTDSILTRNTMAISKNNVNKYKPEKVEIFSTDSEMDSFFKDDILNKNLLSSNSSGNKTDDNTMNEEFDEEEFDQIVSDAKRLTQESRARPHRKTKSKGNHLKNLQNRIDIKNEYEQRHLPIVVDELTEEEQRQIREQADLVNEITRMNRLNKN